MESGYDFVTEPTREQFCPYSGKLMLEPHQTDCCGKHLSAEIANGLVSKSEPCPLCLESPKEVISTRLDKFFQRKLQVYCRFHDQGCQWIGDLVEINNHTSSCEWKPWVCPYCGFQTAHNSSAEHAQSCHRRPIVCQWCKGDLIPYDDYDNHLKTCPLKVVSCDFADVGCAAEFPREQYAHHMSDNTSYHQLLVSKENLKITKTISFKLGIKDEMKRLQEKMKQKDEEIAELKKNVKDREYDISNLKGSMKKKEEWIINLGNKTRTAEGKVQEKMEQIKKLEEEVKKMAAEKEESSLCHQKMEEQIKQLEEEMTAEKEQKLPLLDPSVSQEDRESQARRLQEILEENEEEEEEEEEEEREYSMQTIATLQKIIEDLKSKESLDGGGIKEHVSRLNNLAAKIGGNCAEDPPPSPSSLGAAAKGTGFQGKLKKTLIDGLKQAWGVAIGGDMAYVVDLNGKYGLHIVPLYEDNPSVEEMIASASFSDVTIPAGKCWYPRGVALDRDRNIFMVDTGSHRVLKFSPSGTLLRVAGAESLAGNNSGEFRQPIGICVDLKQERVYVCDSLNHRVQIFTLELVFIGEFGQKGSAPSEFLNPWDVAVDTHSNIYVADCGNRCIKVFEPDTTPLKIVGKGEDKYKKEDLRYPTCLCLDDQNNLYIADKGLKKVIVYNPEGKFKCNFGKFTKPHGIAVDGKGQVYVSDNGGGGLFKQGSGRVTIYH